MKISPSAPTMNSSGFGYKNQRQIEFEKRRKARKNGKSFQEELNKKINEKVGNNINTKA